MTTRKQYAETYRRMSNEKLLELASHGRSYHDEQGWRELAAELNRRELAVPDDRHQEAGSIPGFPSVSELVTLNPLLNKRSPTELAELLAAIRDCGYEWDASERYFRFGPRRIAVRTSMLDALTATSFRKNHTDLLLQSTDSPADIDSGESRSKGSPRLPSPIGCLAWLAAASGVVLAVFAVVLGDWAAVAVRLSGSLLCVVAWHFIVVTDPAWYVESRTEYGIRFGASLPRPIAVALAIVLFWCGCWLILSSVLRGHGA